MAIIAPHAGPSTSTLSDGSRTITVSEATPSSGSSDPSSSTPNHILRLRGGPRGAQRVAWGEDVVDNEGCGKKSSKICCIYHKPRKFDESSSEESSSDSGSDSDSSSDGSHQRQHRHRQQRQHGHAHNHCPRSDSQNGMRSDQQSTVCVLEKDSDRNAYEIMPSSNKGKRKDAMY